MEQPRGQEGAWLAPRAAPRAALTHPRILVQLLSHLRALSDSVLTRLREAEEQARAPAAAVPPQPRR